jgi:hypothetical protein
LGFVMILLSQKAVTAEENKAESGSTFEEEVESEG